MFKKIISVLTDRLFLCLLFVLSMSLSILLGSSVGLYFIVTTVITSIALLVKEFVSLVREMYK